MWAHVTTLRLTLGFREHQNAFSCDYSPVTTRNILQCQYEPINSFFLPSWVLASILWRDWILVLGIHLTVADFEKVSAWPAGHQIWPVHTAKYAVPTKFLMFWLHEIGSFLRMWSVWVLDHDLIWKQINQRKHGTHTVQYAAWAATTECSNHRITMLWFPLQIQDCHLSFLLLLAFQMLLSKDSSLLQEEPKDRTKNC